LLQNSEGGAEAAASEVRAFFLWGAGFHPLKIFFTRSNFCWARLALHIMDVMLAHHSFKLVVVWHR